MYLYSLHCLHDFHYLYETIYRYRADPRDPPTRQALANAEGRTVEGVSKEDIARDAEAIGQLMEVVLTQEKDDKEKVKVGGRWREGGGGRVADREGKGEWEAGWLGRGEGVSDPSVALVS